MASDEGQPPEPAKAEEPHPEETSSGRPLGDPAPVLKDTTKVVIRYQAVGNAPILKQSVFAITASRKFEAVIQALRTVLKYQPSDPLFLYINSAFCPTPDETVANLYKCFGTNNCLIVNYCTTAAWG